MIHSIIFTVLALNLTFINVLAADATVSYLSTLEQNVLAELNLARSKPKQYAEQLTELRPYYHGKELRRPGAVILVTKEGLAALDEAIRYLSLVKPRAKLNPAEGLSKSASDHVRDQAESGRLGHVGSDDSQPWERMNRYGRWQKTAAENISYGAHTARDVVIQLIVDDGIPDRGHRTNIFNLAYHKVGIGCGPHPHFGHMCVMDFAAEFLDASRIKAFQ